MTFELLILDGPQAGRRLPVGPVPAIVGRSSAADLSFPQDSFISGRHVSFQADGRGVLFNDLRSTNGTFLNGERIGQAVAGIGDTVKIGSMTVQVLESRAPLAGPTPAPPEQPLAAWGSTLPSEPFPPGTPPPAFAPAPAFAPPPPAFALPPMAVPPPPAAAYGEPLAATVPFIAQPFPEPASAPALPAAPLPESAPSMDSGATRVLSALNFSAPPPPAPSPSAKALADARGKTEALLAILRETSAPLFCLLHAGAEETVPAMLALADVNLTEHCLLEGEAAVPPPRWAPYLLPLAPEAPLLRLLVEKGWGKGWASFFISFASFDELRTHFRKFLMVQVANGGEVYFRFYEPKTLREFLLAGSPAELTMFFGPIDEWLLEAESKVALLKARNSGNGLVTDLVSLTDGPAAGETLRAF